MAKLTTEARKKIPSSKFAGPGRSYPVEDKAHARDAKSRAAQFASPSEKAKIDAKANKVLKASKGMTKVPPMGGMKKSDSAASSSKSATRMMKMPGPIAPDKLSSMVKSLRG